MVSEQHADEEDSKAELEGMVVEVQVSEEEEDDDDEAALLPSEEEEAAPNQSTHTGVHQKGTERGGQQGVTEEEGM